MPQDTLVHFLLETLKDGRLSRAERQELVARTAKGEPEVPRRAIAEALAEAVRDRMQRPEDKAAVDWLWDVIAVLWQEDAAQAPMGGAAEALFGPEEPLVERLQALLRSSKRQLDVAMFTITDNRLTDALIAAHRRGVAVRVMTDDDKRWDQGSDIRQIADAGIAVRLDRSPYHFHHKFALVDGAVLVTGSYNWTRGAAHDNRENILVTRDASLVRSFSRAFDKMWAELSRG